jgi:alkylated DNA repair protein alkB family protein 8
MNTYYALFQSGQEFLCKKNTSLRSFHPLVKRNLSMRPAFAFAATAVRAARASAMGNEAGEPARADPEQPPTVPAGPPPSSTTAAAATAAAAASAIAPASETPNRASSSSSPSPSRTKVPGLRVIEDVLSEEQHDRVVAWVLKTLDQGRAGLLPGNTYAPIPEKWQKRNQSREMLQFGVYTHSNRVERDKEVPRDIPEELRAVVEALVDKGAYEDSGSNVPESCTVNVYEKGQWIPPHVDNPAFDRPIVTVSLGSTQNMTLWRASGASTEDARATDDRPNVVELPKRSCVVLSGDAADVFEHAVPPVTEKRISLTFRRLGDPDDRRTIDRIARVDSRRAAHRNERERAASRSARPGYGPVGPLGAVGRVGPLPAGVAEAERRARERKRAIAEKHEKKYAASSSAANAGRAGGDGTGTTASGATASGATAPPRDAAPSKSRKKKEAKKAARAEAKKKRKDADASSFVGKGGTSTKKDEKKAFVLSADGVTALEKSARMRSCPACPAELLLPEAPPEPRDAQKDSDRRAARSTARAVPSVEIENVQKVYDAVAKQWHGTRYRAWSGVEDFVNRKVSRGALVADVGCGNGKNAPAVYDAGRLRGGAEVIGCDFSMGLLEICALDRDTPVEVFAADAACLPLRGGAFDAALNVAVLHHISSLARREALAAETVRVLKVNGVALFYAWALEQETGGVSGHRFESQDVFVPFHERSTAIGSSGRKKTPRGSTAVPENETRTFPAGSHTGEARVYQRYCHVFKEGELERLFDHISGWCRVDRAYYDCGNWCAEVTRTK